MATFIHPTAVVEKGTQLGTDVHIGALSVVAAHVEVGDSTTVLNSATLMGHMTIGRDNVIYPYAVLGAPPQDLKYAGSDTRIEIGDSNTIREYVTVNVGTEKGGGVTTVGSGNLLMCSCHIAHDCHVGDRCIISNNVLLAGHIIVGTAAVLSGAVAIHHFASVGEYAFLGGMSRIVQDVPPFLITEGAPARARAVNVVGLRRNGFSDETISALQAAFKAIYRGTGTRAKALDDLEAADPLPEVARLISFLRARMAGKNGRARQP